MLLESRFQVHGLRILQRWRLVPKNSKIVKNSRIVGYKHPPPDSKRHRTTTQQENNPQGS